jgi:hypothetical protein
MAKAEHEIHIENIIELERKKRQQSNKSSNGNDGAQADWPEPSRYLTAYPPLSRSIPIFSLMPWLHGWMISPTGSNARPIMLQLPR